MLANSNNAPYIHHAYHWMKLALSLHQQFIYVNSMTIQDALITTQDQFDKAISHLAQTNMIAIDTEFMRDKTYFSQLCLIQVAGNGRYFAIDPIDTNLDFTAFYELLQNQDIVKVFHAARQDIEIFHLMTGKVPSPLFDSQIAAMVCGLGDQIGYDKLVQHYLGIQIDKSSRFTDWSKRPLSAKQLHYALDDVIHLEKIYPQLKAELTQNNRESWIDAEMAILRDENTYIIDVNEVYKRIKIRSPKPKILNRLRDLAAFREYECRKRDLPRGRFLKDETLIDLAASGPKSYSELSKIRGLQITENSWLTTKLLKLIKEADASDKDSWPVVAKKGPIEKPPAAVLEMLRVLLKHVCDDLGVASRVIASAADLERLALSDDKDQPVLQGWRYEIFGKKALEMKAGRIAITLQGNQICFHPTSNLAVKE